MRILAIIANIAFLGVVCLRIVKDILDGALVDGTEALWVIPLLCTAPVLSLIALILSGKGWLGLYLKRKALEEKRKIEMLEAEMQKGKQ